MQVLQAWGDVAQQAEEQRRTADRLQLRQMRKALQGFFGSWAAHAECMRERRQVAGAHGDAVAKQGLQAYAKMGFLVSSLFACQPLKYQLSLALLCHKGFPAGKGTLSLYHQLGCLYCHTKP